MKQFLPILDWLPKYNKANLSSDVFAGITVGVLLIPQGMAYAMIAGLPPIYGLYASLMPQVVYAFMGSSRQLSVGPVAMDSLLVALGLGALSLSGVNEYVAMAILLAFMMGVVQLILGVAKMGFLVNFLSKPVISGFTSAAAIIIGMSQLKHLLGIDIPGSNKIQHLFVQAVNAIDGTHLLTLSIGIVAIVLIKIMRRINKKIPSALIVVVLGIVTVYLFQWNLQGVKIVEQIPSGLPSFQLPELNSERIGDLIPVALTLALIAFMEAISVSKAVAERHPEYEIDANKELVALGTSNIVGSFFQSYPVTGGFSRTAVNDEAGAKTGISSVVSALVIALTLLFLTPLFYYLPNAVLAAIIMVAVFGLIDFKYPVQLFNRRKDEFFLLIATFIITLTIGIKEGILIGVLLSLLIMVYRTSVPHVAILGKIKGMDYFKNIKRFTEGVENPEEILMLRFDAQLYFANAAFFKKTIEQQVEKKGNALQYIILNAEAINYIDSTAVLMLQTVVEELKQKNITFKIAGSIGPTRDIIHKSGLVNVIGQENIYVRTAEAYEDCLQKVGKSELQNKVALQYK
ncbi:sodium-independent anion transporter [Croceivirga lutea]|uniref:SulP family inorganic anion transporter n=1 Tax=Croceivirga lutea TaxID=1775167 RepID=UPI00198EF7C2|nr:solute carrier family 26 protein [Croceivirga lutea]GGG40826.1 sodium-independent anion transporter [Croceivirga lutea]